LFALTGKELLSLADISRVSRDEAGQLLGYQRPEVRQHVKNIVEYLNSEAVLFPNPIILALSSKTVFKEVRGPKVDDGNAVAGTLEIELPGADEPKPAWIVDGQQRALALSQSSRTDLLVPINAFLADEVDVQRDQFLRINSTKPLPRGLITELLPTVETVLPANLAVRRAPAALCDALNRESSSPFFGLIRRASQGRPKNGPAVFADTALVAMIQESLMTPSGCLFPYRNMATGETDFPAIKRVLYTYWGAVREVFPDAWGLPPTKSRLTHSVGIRAMGRLMDRVMAAVDIRNARAKDQVRREIELIRPVCRWTAGCWEELDGLPWNELQSVQRHIGMLSSILMRAYLTSRNID